MTPLLTMAGIDQPGPRWNLLRPRADNVTTRPAFAKLIVDYFKPSGFCLDPCRGDGAFFDALPEPRDWCEIRAGRDFLKFKRKVDWIITNPPWSGRAYGPIARHAFELAENVVFLVRLQNGLSTYARHLDFLKHGHGLKEIVLVDWRDAGFPTEGFALAVLHWQRGYRGGTALNYELSPEIRQTAQRQFYDRIDESITTTEWYTPPYIFDALESRFDLDPASPGAEVVPWVPADHCYTRQDDGLRQPWHGFVWLNPPYGRKTLPLWVEKFVEHGNGILLVPERTSTRWWQALTSRADLVLCVNKKIAFISATGKQKSAQAIGSTLVAIGDQGVAGLETAHRNGLGRLLRPLPMSLEAAE
jgi:hypothetical protein